MPQRAMDALTTDATKLSFPLQLVVAIVFSTVSAGGAVWATQARTDTKMQEMQSDIRVLLTQQTSAADLSRLRDENAKTERDAARDEVKAIKADQRLLQLQLQAIQLELAKKVR
jgi:hypothetical protein